MNPREDEEEQPLVDIATLPPEGMLIIDPENNAGITKARIDELIQEELNGIAKAPSARADSEAQINTMVKLFDIGVAHKVLGRVQAAETPDGRTRRNRNIIAIEVSERVVENLVRKLATSEGNLSAEKREEIRRYLDDEDEVWNPSHHLHMAYDALLTYAQSAIKAWLEGESDAAGESGKPPLH